MLANRKNSRLFTQFSVMQEITNCGPISRASLAKTTGLSKQTISEVVGMLERDGWVHATGQTSGHVGRSAVTYTVNPEAAMIVSVDLGGTTVRVALVDLGCNIVGELHEETAAAGGIAVVEQIARLTTELAARVGQDMERAMHVVVGVPGVPDEQSGRIGYAPNIADLDKIDFAAELQMRLGVDVTLENDINLAALGEQWAGGNEVDDLALVCVGTGFGAGLILNGSLVRGAHGCAGEMGYMPLAATNGQRRAAPKAGMLESEVGAAGICRDFSKRSGRNKIDVPEIFALAAKGDRIAAEVLDRTAEILAYAVAVLCTVVDPKAIILGGSIGQREELVERVRRQVEAAVALPVQVKATAIGVQAALLGGALVGLTKLHQSLFAGGFTGVDINLPQPQYYAAR